MILLPYEHFTLYTTLSPAQVTAQLQACIEPRRAYRWWIFDKKHKSYEGTLVDGKFEVNRVIAYRNSFLPMIKGVISPDVIGSAVEITMRPHALVILFMLVWVGGIGLAFGSGLIRYLQDIIQSGLQARPDSGLLFPAYMLIFAYGMVMFGFKIEAIKAKRFFRERFNGYEGDEKSG